MATGMKQLLASLLLCCVITVNGKKGAEKEDPCTQGMVAMEVFMEYQGCSGPDPWEIVRSIMRSLDENLSVQSLQQALSAYCSSVPQGMVECFEGNIQNCTAEQRDSLMAVARQTGFLCQPDSSQVHPQVLYVLSRLTEGDLLQDPAQCSGTDVANLHDKCLAEGAAAVGIDSPAAFQRLKALSLEQLAPKVQLYSSTLVECMVAGVRDALIRCARWRGLALALVKDFAFINVLGRHMDFTQQELDQMFEWEASQVQV